MHCGSRPLLSSMLHSLVVAVVLATANPCAAQPYAAGEPVAIPGFAIDGWGQVKDVEARFGVPANGAAKFPAVLILHGSGGVDGRGAFYAKALQEAGIATLEITMFPPGGRPRAGIKATMPFAAAALSWLAMQSAVDSGRLGVMGFSWGAGMTLLMSSDLVRERFGKDSPTPVAYAEMYPTCSIMARVLKAPDSAFFGAGRRMSATPMLIQVGTEDDYEDDAHACDALVASWPQGAREQTTVRYYEGATHGFDLQGRQRQFNDEYSHGGRGGMVRMFPSPRDAEEARMAVVAFFVKQLKPGTHS